MQDAARLAAEREPPAVLKRDRRRLAVQPPLQPAAAPAQEALALSEGRARRQRQHRLPGGGIDPQDQPPRAAVAQHGDLDIASAETDGKPLRRALKSESHAAIIAIGDSTQKRKAGPDGPALIVPVDVS
jgi:hypothetical protein